MTVSTTARPLGQIATRTAAADRPRRTHGMVRAAENREWRNEAAADVARLKKVTVR